MNIQTFDFNNTVVRTVIKDGEPWFVAADIAQALDYTNTNDLTRILDVFEKDTHNVRTPGGMQDMSVINESGLYSAILRSRKPEAKEFKKWVTSEVLPTLRKTGSYSIGSNIPQVEKLKPLAEGCMALNQMLLSMGLDKNAAAIGASNVIRRVAGVNLLELAGTTHFIAEKQEKLFTSTQLGETFTPKISGKMMNTTLAAAGFQTRLGTEWVLTEKGKVYARILDTNKRHSDGTMVQQIKWFKSVLDELNK